ncbi:plasmid replication protein repA [Salinicola sp. CPA57]|uniref:plasmid replication protein repA n=1 Tax=Salinicola sp. CPA57 TaxID=1949080 RepID=UPI000DA18DA9|nr:plasmid replication protein repA [Salinicola sp. CPA57]
MPHFALRWGKAAYLHPGKWWGTGNRCGHDPQKGEFDRLNRPTTQRELPKAQQKLLELVQRYYESPAMLPTLSNLNGRKNLDGNPRSNRSEARAAESLVLSAIVQFLDFASLRVGTPKPDGTFKPRSCGELAKVAGLLDPKCDPSYPQPSERFWRAWRRLKIAGAFTVHQIAEKRPDGSTRARPAIKHINQDFLVALGIGYGKLKEMRDWASRSIKRAKKRFAEQFPGEGDAKKARANLVTGKIAGGGNRSYMPKERRGPRDTPDVNPEKQRQREYSLMVNRWTAEVAQNNPNASPREIRDLVNKKYPPYQVWRDQQNE